MSDRPALTRFQTIDAREIAALVLHARLINILSHGNYSLYEPQAMLDENKTFFKRILEQFLQRYPFNPDLFPEVAEEAEAT